MGQRGLEVTDFDRTAVPWMRPVSNQEGLMGTGIRRLIVTGTAAACLLALTAPAVGDTKTIKAMGGSYGSFHWMPAKRTIAKGDKIVWKNPTDTQHKVVAYGGGWSKNTTLSPNGGKTSKVFNKTGTFKFRCTIDAGTPGAHSSVSGGQCSGMCGKVKVTG